MSEYEEIEKYLNNELSAPELSAFELQMQQDASFAERVKLYTHIYRDIEDSEKELQLQHTLEATSKKYFKKNVGEKAAPPVIKRRQVVLMAVLAAAVVLFFVFRPFFTGIQSTDEIIAEYNGFQKISFAQRSQENNDTLLLIEDLYNNKNFYDAWQQIVLWNSLHNDTELKMLEGRTLLFLNKYPDALDIFEQVSKGQSSFKNEALFFAGLAYLGKGNADSCVIKLKAIPPDAGTYSKAAEIINKLEK